MIVKLTSGNCGVERHGDVKVGRVIADLSAELLISHAPVHPVQVLRGHEALPGQGAGAVLQGLGDTVLGLARLPTLGEQEAHLPVGGGPGAIMGEDAALCVVGASLLTLRHGGECEGRQEVGVAIAVILHITLRTLHVTEGQLSGATKIQREKYDKVFFNHFVAIFKIDKSQ